MENESVRGLPGIGPWTEARLAEAGVYTLEDLSASSAERIYEASGEELDLDKVGLWIQEAKRRLGMGPVGGSSRDVFSSVKGVGPVTRLRLRAEGIHHPRDVVSYTPEQLADVIDRSERIAKRILRRAKRTVRNRETTKQPIPEQLAEGVWPGTAPPSPRYDPHEDLWPQDEDKWMESKEVKTSCGLSVRSTPEAWIADFLYDEGIYSVYEPLICGYRPDFYIPGWGLIIEYWGWTSPAYRERRERKIEAYRTTGYSIVNLERADGKNEKTLTTTLRQQLLQRRPTLPEDRA